MAKRKKQPEEMGVGRLILRRFCGEEEFVLVDASMFAYRTGEGVRLCFDAETKGTCVRACKDTAPHRPRPKLSIRIDLPALVPGELMGRRFAPTNREPNGDPPGTVHYFETGELRECAVEVLRRDGAVFEARLTGLTTDVNYYDGSKPQTRVEAVGRFTFAEVMEWEPG